MKRAEVFATLKTVNQLVDKMTTVSTDSKEYQDWADELYWAMEILTMGYHPWYSVHLSKKTGHYYIKVAD